LADTGYLADENDKVSWSAEKEGWERVHVLDAYEVLSPFLFWNTYSFLAVYGPTRKRRKKY
jgi:hypothetical protein